MGRKIGVLVIKVCEIVESFGTCSSRQVMPLLGVELPNTIKYLSRAVSYGLLTVDRSKTPHQFGTLQDWRERLKVAKPISGPTPAPTTEACSDGEAIVRRAIRTQPNSVFSLASLMG